MSSRTCTTTLRIMGTALWHARHSLPGYDAAWQNPNQAACPAMHCSFPSEGGDIYSPDVSQSSHTAWVVLQEINVSTDPAQMVGHAANRQHSILLLAILIHTSACSMLLHQSDLEAKPRRSSVLTNNASCSHVEDVLTGNYLGCQALNA